MELSEVLSVVYTGLGVWTIYGLYRVFLLNRWMEIIPTLLVVPTSPCSCRVCTLAVQGGSSSTGPTYLLYKPFGSSGRFGDDDDDGHH